MRINRLINDYYLDPKLVELLQKNNSSLVNGISFQVDQGILLDFFKTHFYFHSQDEYLSKEILKYKFFINEKDQFDLEVLDSDLKVILSIQKATRETLFFGPLREKILDMGWISCHNKTYTLKVKKYQSYFFLEELDFNEDYLSNLIQNILMSNRIRSDVLNINPNDLTSDFMENLLYLQDRFEKYSKNDAFKKQIASVIKDLKLTREITPALNLVGINRFDFWSETFKS
jgi:hypothetical protein